MLLMPKGVKCPKSLKGRWGAYINIWRESLMLKLDSMLFEKVNERLQEKIQWWKERYPALEFDVNGRAIVGQLPKIDEELIRDDLCFGWSYAYKKAFSKYLEQNEYKIKDKYAEYRGYNRNFDSFYEFSYNDLIENSFHFEKADGRKVNVKASRVLQAIHKIWIEEYHPEYQLIIDEIKRLRGEGFTYSNSEDVVNLTKDKERLGGGNLSIKYEDVLNSNAGTRNLYLSINPLDKLTSSGCEGDNPTGFSSCWSLGFDKDGTEYNVEARGCYSNPQGQVALGSIINTGMIYIPNGKTLEVNGFSFLGYKERSHVWIDENGLWIEKLYPCKDDRRKKNMREICSKIFPIIKDEDVQEYEEFSIQDTEGIKNYCNAVQQGYKIFLDRVAIDRNNDYKMVYLTQDRVDYNYSNPDDIPEERTRCSECGEYHDEDDMEYVAEIDGYLCSSCFNEGYAYCYHCNHIHRKCDMTWINSADSYVCDRCLNSRYTQCEHCDEWVEDGDITEVKDSNGYTAKICSDCKDDHYEYCSDCDMYVHEDYMSTGTDGERYCDDCIDNHKDEDNEEEVEEEELELELEVTINE
jgi:hypothetical protein